MAYLTVSQDPSIAIAKGPNVSDQAFTQPITSQQSAVLYIFTPRSITKHYKRPLVCNFNHEFSENLYKTLQSSVGMGKSHTPHIERLLNMPSSLSAIVPSNDGNLVNTDMLSQNFTFMLMVNNDVPTYNGEMFSSHCNNKTIYTGFCIDEPINMTNHGQGHTPNEGAYIVITHKTVINATPQIDPRGSRNRIDTISDVDVLPGQTLATMSTEPMFVNRPGDIRDMTVQDGIDIVTTMTPEKSVCSEESHIPMTAKLNSPKEYNRLVVSGIASAFEAISDAEYSGTLGAVDVPLFSTNSAPGLVGSDNMNSHIDTYLADNTNESFIGLDINRPINIGVLIRTYNPQIVPIQVPGTEQFTPRPQEYKCPQNVFSSLISSAMPTFMANIGIAEFAFAHNSYHGQTKVLNVAPFAPIGEVELQSRIDVLLRMIDNNIFSIIRNMVGEFDVTISASNIYDTHVELNLMDSSLAPGEIYQHHTFLGGIGNNLTAGSNIISHNSASLGHLYNKFNTNI